MDSKKRGIIIAIMVAMFLGAVEGTVVTTAIPTIVKDLNGFELISWVFSSYLLTSAISTPIYGKLSDLYGRKNILTIGIIIFLVGSSLCGLSHNMYQLIGFRALQGIGAGAIFTVTYTIVGDIFTLAERAKVQGWLSTVWGIASLIGPFLGGFLIDNFSWHWIFFINIPFGILSIVLLQKNLDEKFERKRHKIDYLGTLLLSAAIISILYAVLTGGKTNKWYSSSTIALFFTAGTMMIMFYFVEKKAEEPIIPFEIFTKANIIINIISFFTSAILIGADVYMPVYMQNVLGYSATAAGLSMAPMSVAWLLSSIFLVKHIAKRGEKTVIGISILILLISCALLPLLGVKSSLIMVVIIVFIMGFGFGGAFTTLTIMVQASVDYSKRGAATASNSLVRTLGQTIGVSVFGSMLNLNIIKYFEKMGITGVEPNNINSTSSIGVNISIEHVKASLNSGLHVIFIAFIIFTVISLLMSTTLANELKENV
jgi:EmrB/QacA subfamily drug resistance transporter